MTNSEWADEVLRLYMEGKSFDEAWNIVSKMLSAEQRRKARERIKAVYNSFKGDK